MSKTYIRWLVPFIVVISWISVPSVSAGEISRPMGEGLPIPWPFPWAKDCPVNWKSLEGHYVLSDNNAGESIDLKVSVISEIGFKVVRISRYAHDGSVVSDGYSFVARNSNLIRLWMFPLRRNEVPTWAVIKLYFSNPELACAEEELTPILTLDKIDKYTHVRTQYRLVRVPNYRPK